MCVECGCEASKHDETVDQHAHFHGHAHHGDDGPRVLTVSERILAANDLLAEQNRRFLASRGVLALNLLSAPGSGKTSLLERTLVELRGQHRFAVLEGDQQTDHDAARIAATGVPAWQINTGTGCHLDAHLVAHGMAHLDLHETDVLFIENVGNLVCPAGFDLGEDARVVLFSVTEGEDKPAKYPHMFQTADVVVLCKTDLLPYVPFDMTRCRAQLAAVNPTAPVIELSSLDGAGLAGWYDWLRRALAAKRRTDASTLTP